MQKPAKGKALTKELAQLATEAHTTKPDGTVVTKEQALAELIWRQALGWSELQKDDHGKLIEKHHPPIAWCQQFIYERIEGKAAQASAENSGGMRASEKVGNLAKDRLNKLAVSKAQPSDV
jgi:hypothetical protein